MAVSLFNLENRLLRLKNECCHDDIFFEQLSSFMKHFCSLITEWKSDSLRDFLKLKDLHSNFLYLMDDLDFVPDRYHISELEDRINFGVTSLFLDVDIDEMKETEWHEYAINSYDRYYKDLLRESQKFKSSRRAEINEDIWGKMLQEEENNIENSIDEGQYYDAQYKKTLLRMSRANELCIKTTNKDAWYYGFINNLKSTNYIEAFGQALRLNILLSETFPDTLKPQFEAWLKGEDYKNPEPEQAQEGTQAEVKTVKRNGGRSPELLFKDAEETEKMKKNFLEYIQSELEITQEDLRKMEFDCKRKSKLNTAIVKWLKQLKSENILDKTSVIPQRAAYRFLSECFRGCGVSINAIEKTYSNKLGEWLK